MAESFSALPRIYTGRNVTPEFSYGIGGTRVGLRLVTLDFTLLSQKLAIDLEYSRDGGATWVYGGGFSLPGDIRIVLPMEPFAVSLPVEPPQGQTWLVHGVITVNGFITIAIDGGQI